MRGALAAAAAKLLSSRRRRKARARIATPRASSRVIVEPRPESPPERAVRHRQHQLVGAAHERQLHGSTVDESLPTPANYSFAWSVAHSPLGWRRTTAWKVPRAVESVISSS